MISNAEDAPSVALVPNELREALESAMGVLFSQWRPAEVMGTYSQAFLARIGSQEVVIKCTARRNSYPAEIWVYDRLRSLGVLVPTVIYYIPELAPSRVPCLVMTRLDGVPLFQDARAGEWEIDLCAAIGGALSRLHEVHLGAAPFGYGAFASECTGGHFETWGDFIRHIHEVPHVFDALLGSRLIDTKCHANLQEVAAHIENHAFSRVLVHGDLGPDHIYVRTGNFTGIIDPGNAFAGPAEYDLAYFGVYVAETQLVRVLEAYTRSFDMMQIRNYMAIISCHKAIRAHTTGAFSRREKFLTILERCCG